LPNAADWVTKLDMHGPVISNEKQPTAQTLSQHTFLILFEIQSSLQKLIYWAEFASNQARQITSGGSYTPLRKLTSTQISKDAVSRTNQLRTIVRDFSWSPINGPESTRWKELNCLL